MLSRATAGIAGRMDQGGAVITGSFEAVAQIPGKSV